VKTYGCTDVCGGFFSLFVFVSAFSDLYVMHMKIGKRLVGHGSRNM